MPLYSFGEHRVSLIGEHHYIAPTAALIGQVTLESGANIWFNVVIRGDNDRIVIGERTNIQDGSVLHVDRGFPLTVGPGVSIGHKVMLHGCTIGSGSLIGMNAVVMNGATIGRESLLGANSLVPEGKMIPEGVLAMGSPAKVVRELKLEEREYLTRIPDSYCQRAKQYLAQLREQV